MGSEKVYFQKMELSTIVIDKSILVHPYEQFFTITLFGHLNRHVDII